MTKLMGNGEGHTVLILTDAESRLIRQELARHHAKHRLGPDGENPAAACAAYARGVQRGTDKLKAEFDAEQKARKAQEKP